MSLLPFNDSAKIYAPKPWDERYLKNGIEPYTSKAEVIALISYPYEGLAVVINGEETDNEDVLYWMKDGVGIDNLVPMMEITRMSDTQFAFNSNGEVILKPITQEILTDASTIQWDLAVKGSYVKVTLGAASRSLNIVGLVAGVASIGELTVIHGISGSVISTVDNGNKETGFSWAAGTNAITKLSFEWDGANLFWYSSTFGVPVTTAASTTAAATTTGAATTTAAATTTGAATTTAAATTTGAATTTAAATTTGAYADANTNAVIAAIQGTGVTLTTAQKDAINNRILAKKADGVWDKQYYFGFVGGTSAAHHIEWTTATSMGSDFGSVIHNANGVTMGASSTAFKTGISPATAWADKNSTHFGFYSMVNNAADVVDMGCGLDSDQTSTYIATRFSGGLADKMLTANTYEGINNADNTDSRGYYNSVRQSVNLLKMFKNGSAVATGTNSNAAYSLATSKFYLGAKNDSTGPAGDFCNMVAANRRYGSCWIGKTALTDAEVAADYTSEQLFQTALSRNA